MVPIEAYGPAKVACEEAVVAAMGAEHSALARAGLICGYGDRSDRFGYWPARVDRAGDGEPVLVPPRDTPLQVIDVEDLAAWLVHLAEDRVPGAFNALGDVTTVGAVLDACDAATGRRPSYVEVGDGWLAEHEVKPWMGPESLPLWLPQPEYAGFMTRTQRRRTRCGAHPAPGGRHRPCGAGMGAGARAGAGPARRPDPPHETELVAAAG